MKGFLESDRLRLRAVEPADSRFAWQVETDSAQWVENGMCAPYSLHNLEEYARNYDADPFRCGQLRLIIEQKTAGSAGNVGIIDLYDISASGRTAFVGIYILPEFRGRGFGEEALALMEEYCRNLLNLRLLGVKIAASNKASFYLFRNAGYSLNGGMPGWILSGKEEIDILLFSKRL